jgi:hypothetical protein
MTGPFRATDGSVGTPSISFNSETASGLYHPAAGQIAVSIQGVLRATFSATGLSVTGDVSATGAFSGSGANLTNLNASNLASGTVPDARFPSALPAISGANLTNLNASNLASGTVPDARFPATLPAVSGANLTNLNASNLASGTVPTARLGSGTASSGTFLRGDGAWTNTLSGDYLRVSKNTYSGIEIETPNNPVDEKKWYIVTTSSSINIQSQNDAATLGQTAISIYRSGHVITGWVFYINNNSVISADNNLRVTIYAPASGSHSISGETRYNPADGPSNVEIGFRRVPRTTDTTLNTAKVAQCIALTSGVTIPANTYAAGDSFSIYNDSASSITLTQGSGLTLRQAGTSNTGNRTLAQRGLATIWFNSATEAIISGAGVS